LRRALCMIAFPSHEEGFQCLLPTQRTEGGLVNNEIKCSR
jgi:hypothetical protein